MQYLQARPKYFEHENGNQRMKYVGIQKKRELSLPFS